MSPSPTAEAIAPMVGPGFFRDDMPIHDLTRSDLNPRQRFDQAGLDELAKSIVEVGVIEPLVARPVGDHYELVAGERRWRASKLAGLTVVPCIVKHLSDAQALEIMVIENNQREDVNALEEAEGFSRLLKSGYTHDRLAERLGRSKKYVYDRIKLLDLAPPAKQLLLEGTITAGHGILLARLKPVDQLRALDVDNGGVFESEDGLTDEEEAAAYEAQESREDLEAHARRKRSKLAAGELAVDEFSARDIIGMKPKSVRETAHWIAEHVRFKPHEAAQAAPLEYGEVEQRVLEASAKPGRGKKVIAITFDHYIQPEARDEKERTYGPRSFKFADGKPHRDYGDYGNKPKPTKICEHSVLGVVAVGEMYGQAFEVCIARDKCQVHWKSEIAARGANKPGKRKQAVSRWEKEQQERREREEKVEARWKVFLPALKKAVHEARGRVKAVTGPLYAAVLKAHELPAGIKPADLPMAMLDSMLKTHFGGHYIWAGQEPRLVAVATLLGVDVKALEPPRPSEPKAVQTSAQKKPAKKKR